MSFGVYVHWPYCLSKCPYCDFNSHVAENIDHQKWLQAYCNEIDFIHAKTKDKIVETIFFGGGTPSLMKPDIVAEIIAYIRKKWRTSNDWEVTLEANPTSVEADKFKAFREAGVNRVSLGIQSLKADDLKFLGRTHDVTQARHAIELAQKYFDRFSFDLIYARPEQSISDWKLELQQALEMAVGHISLYQLTIEKGTPFFIQHSRGDFKIPEQEIGAEFYDVTQDVLNNAGLEAYEVSNHARKGEESRHNLIYWRYGDYAGIGAGAHGRLTIGEDKLATRAHRAPDIWLEKALTQGHGYHPFEALNRNQRMNEALMMGLRLYEGVPIDRLHSELNDDFYNVISPSKVRRLIDEGYLMDTPNKIQATQMGIRCLNAVLDFLLN